MHDNNARLLGDSTQYQPIAKTAYRNRPSTVNRRRLTFPHCREMSTLPHHFCPRRQTGMGLSSSARYIPPAHESHVRVQWGHVTQGIPGIRS